MDGVEAYGRVASVRGLMVEVAGPIHAMSVGARLTIETGAAKIPCEVVGFSGGHALAMPFAALDGVRRGCRGCRYHRCRDHSPVSGGWDALSTPAPSRSTAGAVASWPRGLSVPSVAATGSLRRRVGDPLDLGVRSTPSSPSAAASGWASSRPRRCRPCALGRRCLHL